MINKNKCDLVILVPHLGDGGTQKVVTTLANAWNKRGKNITVVTIYDHSDDYVLDTGVKRIRLNQVVPERYILLAALLFKLETFSQKIKERKLLYLLSIPLLYLVTSIFYLIQILVFVTKFASAIIIRAKDIVFNLKDKVINLIQNIVFKARIYVENILGIFINILNDFIDEFIEFIKAFENRFGLRFFGISYYFIMAIFYIRKFIRISIRVLVKAIYFPITMYKIPITMYKNILRYYKRKKKQAGPYLHILSRARTIRGIVKSENPEVVLSFIGSTNILTIIACKFLGRRIVISERNDPAIQELNHPYNKLRPYVYKYADIITANTHNALATMKKYVPENKLRYVPNPLDLNILNNKITKTEKSHHYILSVGRLHEQKAYDILLEAFKLISHEVDNWRLLILGKGELKKELHQLANNLDISDLVIWKGHVSNPYKYYDMADIFVLPSRHEGMSNSLLEAMIFGLPVVISDACFGLLELIKDDVNGIVIPVNDPNALANAIIKLIKDESLRNFLGSNARESVKKFELNNVLDTWEKILYSS